MKTTITTPKINIMPDQAREMDKFQAMDSLVDTKYFLMEGRIPDEAEEQFIQECLAGMTAFFHLVMTQRICLL